MSVTCMLFGHVEVSQMPRRSISRRCPDLSLKPTWVQSSLHATQASGTDTLTTPSLSQQIPPRGRADQWAGRLDELSLPQLEQPAATPTPAPTHLDLARVYSQYHHQPETSTRRSVSLDLCSDSDPQQRGEQPPRSDHQHGKRRVIARRLVPHWYTLSCPTRDPTRRTTDIQSPILGLVRLVRIALLAHQQRRAWTVTVLGQTQSTPWLIRSDPLVDDCRGEQQRTEPIRERADTSSTSPSPDTG